MQFKFVPSQIFSAPCSPEIISVSKETLSVISVHWLANNDEATYTVTAKGEAGMWDCTSSGNSCTLHNLPCGSLFSISAVASTEAGHSLPSYSIPLETGKLHLTRDVIYYLLYTLYASLPLYGR